MSETPTPQEKNSRRLDAAKVAAGLIGLTAAAYGFDTLVDNNDAIKVWNEEQLKNPSEYIVEATHAQYSSDDRIGEFVIKDGGLEAPALDAIHAYLGDSVYDSKYPIFYDTLLISAQEQSKQHIPQPGDEYAVVKADLDPEKNDGLEYLVVQKGQIIESEAKIPTPIIESVSPEN